jgi:hypothetical protein
VKNENRDNLTSLHSSCINKQNAKTLGLPHHRDIAAAMLRGGRIPHVVSGSVGPPKSINRVKTICMANYDR